MLVFFTHFSRRNSDKLIMTSPELAKLFARDLQRLHKEIEAYQDDK
jgi:hypothetical protein